MKKVCVITGASGGIGKETAVAVAREGYHTFLLVRESEKSRNAQKEIIERSGNSDVELIYVDLSSQESLKAAVNQLNEKVSSIDLLINNGGVVKRKKESSADGIEMTLAVNYFAPVLLTLSLLPLLKQSESARVINLSSELYQRGMINSDNPLSLKKFNGDMAYANSKLLLIHFTKVLAQKLKETAITVNCLHPGVVGTDVFREYPKWFNAILNLFISKPSEGSKPVIQLALANEYTAMSGEYFTKTVLQKNLKKAFDSSQSEVIWKKTLAQLNLSEPQL